MKSVITIGQQGSTFFYVRLQEPINLILLTSTFLMASSFSGPAGRKKSPQGATGPSTLNVPQEEQSPANEHSHEFKIARNGQLVGQDRKQLGIPCH
ncbi:hypothetical protein AVEN_234274-1 [Araneus ventricosus]|uniref:Uncharacterized protein n=1 Tax=Araneus ventricosus TaxID=182803 RepID=A0A4Y2A8Q5_ARAVE|nr:hypothetical protein AVEN_234274-1 [Araneus ventricosus]